MNTGHTRTAALELLEQYTQSPGLLKHAFAVETCLRAYGETEAARLELDDSAAQAFIETYSITGLLHDFDYDQHPSLAEHPYVGNKILAELGWPEEIRHAIMAHADYTGTPRDSHLDKALFACDELAGFLTACALVKPGKSIHDVEVAGVKKKLKDKAFARGVSREDVVNGAAGLDVGLDEHIEVCLRAMQRNAEGLGLAGAKVESSVAHVPNATTIAAIEAGERGEVFRAETIEELMADLHAED